MRVVVMFMLASAAVQANQCSGGGECPSDIEPNNVASLLETKIQMDVLRDGVEAKRCSSGGKCPSVDNSPYVVSLFQAKLQMNMMATEEASNENDGGLNAHARITRAHYAHLSEEGAAMMMPFARQRANISAARRQPATESCPYGPEEVVLYWREGIFSDRPTARITKDTCDVECVEAGTHESCLERADGVVYHIPLHYGPPDKGARFSFGLSMEPEANHADQIPANQKHNGFSASVTTDPKSDVRIFYWTPAALEKVQQEKVPGFKERLPYAAFMAAHSGGSRVKLIEKLAEHGVPVHSLGVFAPKGTEAKHTNAIALGDKISFLKDYRVYFAFENSIENGYVTEKPLDGFKAGCVNAYLGAPDYDFFMPKDSIISIPSEGFMEDAAVARLAAQIKEALYNQTAWEQYNKWKQVQMEAIDGGRFLARWGKAHQVPPDSLFAGSSCQMCRMLHAKKYPDEYVFDQVTKRLTQTRSPSSPSLNQLGLGRNKPR